MRQSQIAREALHPMQVAAHVDAVGFQAFQNPGLGMLGTLRAAQADDPARGALEQLFNQVQPQIAGGSGQEHDRRLVPVGMRQAVRPDVFFQVDVLLQRLCMLA
ncbi:hypothetical protein D3C87_1701980 [compost metagenome]